MPDRPSFNEAEKVGSHAGVPVDCISRQARKRSPRGAIGEDRNALHGASGVVPGCHHAFVNRSAGLHHIENLARSRPPAVYGPQQVRDLSWFPAPKCVSERLL